jgi:hypothetical protein
MTVCVSFWSRYSLSLRRKSRLSVLRQRKKHGQQHEAQRRYVKKPHYPRDVQRQPSLQR